MINIEIDKDVYLPSFHHLLDESDIDIELIWGGRDSGKSKFVAQYLTEQSLACDYFRCLLIKKTHESIKDAQWQMIKDTTEQWGLDGLFTFRTAPLSIKCANGNTFSTRGMDQASKIRSFTNPSHVWIEEGNQINEEDFITILTGMRSDHGKVKVYITFNPESTDPDFNDFWLFKMFFSHTQELSFTGEVQKKLMVKGEQKTITLKYRSTHVTYHDNEYVTDQRIAFHESLETTNFYWYRVFTLGLWGNKENDSPWAYAFDVKKHVGHVQYNKDQVTYCSFDFNRNPMTCSIIQHYEGKIRVVESIKIPKSGTDEVCDYILATYPKAMYIVTGDYSGNNESSMFKETTTHYTIIKQKLKLGNNQIRIKPNPRLEKNQQLVNKILQYYPVIIDQDKCKPLIFDLTNVKKRADGTIEKADRNKVEQQADSLDTFRYFCNIEMEWFSKI